MKAQQDLKFQEEFFCGRSLAKHNKIQGKTDVSQLVIQTQEI